jgi:hypothetical protein
VRELHVLGVSEDGSTLLLGTAKNATKPTHRIPLDDRLRTAARGQLAPFGSDRAQSELSPKEMQSRLREGATVEEVAKAAGVPVARVLPYFVPVEAERTRIVDEARAARMHRNRGPAASTPLGQAVDTRLQDVTGIKPETIAWTARRRRDGAWVVGVSYNARGRRKAEWLWQPLSREVTPLDPAAARLGADATPAPAKRKTAAAKPAPAKAKARPKPKPKPQPKAKPAAKKAATAAPARKVARAVKPVKPAAVPKRAAAKKAAPTSVRKKVAATRPAAKPVKPAAAAKRPSVKPPTRKHAVTKPRRPRVVPTPVPEDDGPYFEPAVIQLPVAVPVPAPIEEPPAAVVEPLEPGEEQPAAPAASSRRPGQRVPVPSWSDVLLGVTGQRDESRRSG